MKRYVSATALCRSLFAALVVCGLAQNVDAQSLPSPWTAQDVGSPTLSGIATYSSGVFTVDGAGTDIFSSSDQFQFVYQRVTGDVEIVARVNSLDEVYDYTNAGVMIRSSLTAGSSHGYSTVTALRGVYFRRRLTTGATTTAVSGPEAGAPVWLRLVRRGSMLTSYSSANGTSWTTLGSSTVSLGSTAYVGLAVTSHRSTTRATAVFSNVRVTPLTSSSSTPTSTSSALRGVDIGSPRIAGSTTYSSGTYRISAAGQDIWDVADQFHFAYQAITGDATVVARVQSLTNTDDWAKAGVMIRESLTAQSRHAMVVVSAAQGRAFQRRDQTGEYSSHTSGGSGTAPVWLRLVRAGDLFTAYRSADGTSWTQIGSDTIPMGDTVYAGLAATSHDAYAATSVVVDNVRITSSTATGNRAPSISITSPANNASFTAPTTVSIAATASDPENRMTSVDFYAGSTLITRDTTAPYSASWSPGSAGTYPLTAVAHDADGGSSTSATVNVSVQTSTNRPPTVTLSTGGVLTFNAPAAITMTASASDPEGRLARVEFFNGSTRLYSDTSAPYSYSWSNVAAGSYTLTAVAYDAAGARATSAALAVTVRSSTTSTAPRLLVFTASTNHATSVTNYVLKVFTSTANPATATPLATSDLGKPAPASSGDITVDRSSFFGALTAGTYRATVTAIGPGGQTQSASISFTR